jgi:hypothetical protein
VTPSQSPSPTPTRTMTYELWFNLDGYLFVTHRTEPFTPGVGVRTLEALLSGPNAAETAASVGSAINPGTRLLGLTIHDGVATVNLDETFNGQETPAIAVGSLSQIVYTLTQFDSIDGVRFEVNPEIGERVSSPITISGTADVFEAVVSIAILDEHRRTVASSFTMATCGTGCRGSYTTDVRYDVGTRQPGTIRVYEVSAKDGSPLHVVEIPVILTP